MRFLEYLFFKYYNWQIKVGNGDMSSFLSVLFISFSFTLYFVDIIMFYFFFLASNGDFLNNKYLFIIVFILFFYIVFSSCYKRERYSNYGEIQKGMDRKKTLRSYIIPLYCFYHIKY